MALGALKQMCTYQHEGKTFVPGDADYDPAHVRSLGIHDTAAELHRALKTKNDDGLNALLDRWFSANLAYTPDPIAVKALVCPEHASFKKEITLDEHVKHAVGHLGRAASHLDAMKESLGEAAKRVQKDAVSDTQNKQQVAHHLGKSREHLGRASEQQKMADRHLNALTGNAQYSEQGDYKEGEKQSRTAGQHMAAMDDAMIDLSAASIPAAGEDSGEKQARVSAATDAHKRVMQHHQAAQDALAKSRASLPKAVDKGFDMAGEHYLNIIKRRADNEPESFELFAPIMKIEKTEDGDLLVSGWGSVSEYVDSQDDIVDGEGLRLAVDAWKKWGNIRLMHQADAVGTATAKGCEIDIRKHPDTGSDALWLTALIVADHAKRLVETGVIKGFSIGGKCIESVTEVIEVPQAA